MWGGPRVGIIPLPGLAVRCLPRISDPPCAVARGGNSLLLHPAPALLGFGIASWHIISNPHNLINCHPILCCCSVVAALQLGRIWVLVFSCNRIERVADGSQIAAWRRGCVMRQNPTEFRLLPTNLPPYPATQVATTGRSRPPRGPGPCVTPTDPRIDNITSPPASCIQPFCRFRGYKPSDPIRPQSRAPSAPYQQLCPGVQASRPRFVCPGNPAWLVQVPR